MNNMNKRANDDAVVKRVNEISDVDVEFGSYMAKVYSYMTLGVFITGAVAYAIANYPLLLNSIVSSRFLFFFTLTVPLLLVIVMGTSIARLSPNKALSLFLLYATVMGLPFSVLIALFDPGSVVSIFASTVAVFAAMALFGYTTKRNLTSLGSFMLVGLVGVIIAGIINMFVGNSFLSLGLSILSVVIFVGLTAHDVQAIKYSYSLADNADSAKKKAIFGALTIYLDFVNLFINLLRIFGKRK
jgi:FtsH-binding integral membrane protein